MKKLLLILFFIPFLSYAQSGEGAENKIPLFNDSLSFHSGLLYIVDGIPKTYEEVQQLEVENIETIQILKEVASSTIFCNQPKGVVVITTRKPVEYEITVLDSGYYMFLATQPSPNFYSEQSLKSKNMSMVAEWNYRHRNPLNYNPDIYEVEIDYDHNIDYGLEVEYKLYMFFQFMMKENGISLI